MQTQLYSRCFMPSHFVQKKDDDDDDYDCDDDVVLCLVSLINSLNLFHQYQTQILHLLTAETKQQIFANWHLNQFN